MVLFLRSTVVFSWSRKLVAIVVCSTFFLTNIISPIYAQTVFNLPQPGSMVALSEAFVPIALKGIVVHPNDPLLFDFIVDQGNAPLQKGGLRDEAPRLVKYFLAGLAVPEKDLWVNLAPQEKSRVMPDQLSHTGVGREMLAQDYLLKQLTASLIYPENDLGKKFWDKVYQRVYEQYGTIDIPVDTFNKVWITPDVAEVYQDNAKAVITGAHLKVMLESDYAAAHNNLFATRGHSAPEGGSVSPSTLPAELALDMKATQGANRLPSQELAKDVVREVILPVIEKEVNEGKNFAALRQVFQSLILAGWYKKALKDSLLSQVYAETNKVDGITILEKDAKEKVYAQYMEAYRKGVFNYIKDDEWREQNPVPTWGHSAPEGGSVSPSTLPAELAMDTKATQVADPMPYQGEPRHYFSGGVVWDQAMAPSIVTNFSEVKGKIDFAGNTFQASFKMHPLVDAAQVNDEVLGLTQWENISEQVGIILSAKGISENKLKGMAERIVQTANESGGSFGEKKARAMALADRYVVDAAQSSLRASEQVRKEALFASKGILMMHGFKDASAEKLVKTFLLFQDNYQMNDAAWQGFQLLLAYVVSRLSIKDKEGVLEQADFEQEPFLSLKLNILQSLSKNHLDAPFWLEMMEDVVSFWHFQGRGFPEIESHVMKLISRLGKVAVLTQSLDSSLLEQAKTLIPAGLKEYEERLNHDSFFKVIDPIVYLSLLSQGNMTIAVEFLKNLSTIMGYYAVLDSAQNVALTATELEDLKAIVTDRLKAYKFDGERLNAAVNNVVMVWGNSEAGFERVKGLALEMSDIIGKAGKVHLNEAEFAEVKEAVSAELLSRGFENDRLTKTVSDVLGLWVYRLDLSFAEIKQNAVTFSRLMDSKGADAAQSSLDDVALETIQHQVRTKLVLYGFSGEHLEGTLKNIVDVWGKKEGLSFTDALNNALVMSDIVGKTFGKKVVTDAQVAAIQNEVRKVLLSRGFHEDRLNILLPLLVDMWTSREDLSFEEMKKGAVALSWQIELPVIDAAQNNVSKVEKAALISYAKSVFVNFGLKDTYVNSLAEGVVSQALAKKMSLAQKIEFVIANANADVKKAEEDVNKASWFKDTSSPDSVANNKDQDLFDVATRMALTSAALDLFHNHGFKGDVWTTKAQMIVAQVQKGKKLFAATREEVVQLAYAELRKPRQDVAQNKFDEAKLKLLTNDAKAIFKNHRLEGEDWDRKAEEIAKKVFGLEKNILPAQENVTAMAVRAVVLQMQDHPELIQNFSQQTKVGLMNVVSDVFENNRLSGDVWSQKVREIVDLVIRKGMDLHLTKEYALAMAKAAAFESRLDKAQNLGGIDLGMGNYLKVTAKDAAGMPMFDPARLRQLKQDLLGVEPVLMGQVQPVNLHALFGL